MSEQRDDTPEQDEPSRTEREQKPASYYYDDSTGYEIYDPAEDDSNEEENVNDEMEKGDGKLKTEPRGIRRICD